MKENLLIGTVIVLTILATFAFGYRTGGNAVKVEYQAMIDTQKNEAEALREQNEKLVNDKQNANEAIKATIEKERQANVKTTNDYRNQLSALSLRFKSVTGGASGANQVSNKDGTASDTNTAYIELPASLTASLRAITYDCDTLLNDYEALYNFVWDIK